jgi:hypothetical protein
MENKIPINSKHQNKIKTWDSQISYLFLNFKEKTKKLKKFVLKWKVIKILTAMEIPRRAKRKAEKETSTNRGTSTERPTTTSRGSWRIWRLKSLKMKKKNVRTAKQYYYHLVINKIDQNIA